MSIVTFGDRLNLHYRSAGTIYKPFQEQGVIKKVDTYVKMKMAIHADGVHFSARYKTTFTRKQIVDVCWQEDGLQPAKIVGFAWVEKGPCKFDLRAEVKPLGECKSYYVYIESLQARAAEPRPKRPCRR